MNRLYSLLFILFLGTTTSYAQQEQSLFFMENNFYSHYTNPATLPKYKFMSNMILPSGYFNLSNTGFSFNDLLEEQPNGNYLISPELLLGSLRERNFFQMNYHLDPLSFAFRAGKMHFSFNYSLKTSFYMDYPRSLLDLAWNGNGQFLDETVDIGPDFQFMLYNEFAIGGGYEISDKVTVGGRIKILVGGFDASTDRSSATIYTDPEIYQVRLATDYRVNVSAFYIPPDVRNVDSTDSDQVDFSGFPQVLGPNIGGAFDLGVTYKLNDKLTLSASLLDVGAIRWTSNATNFYSNGEFDYEGVDVSALVENEEEVGFDAITDTLVERLQFVQTQDAYSTWLPAKLYIGAEYKVTDWFTGGAMVYSEFYKGNVFPAFSLSAQFHAGRILSAGLVYGIRNRRFDNLGFNMVLTFGAFQIFTVSDNIIPIFSPLSARNTNFRGGLYFNINRTDKE